MNNSKIKIMFVDDEPNILMSIRRQIKNDSIDWSVDFISDSIEARDLLLNNVYDIVVTDINMPNMDGFELINQIRNKKEIYSPEFIVLTGIGDSSLKKQALKLGAIDLLNKPVQKEDLLARMYNAIRLQKARRAIVEKNKRLEEQLMQEQKMRLIGLMASGLAHDFNNILTVIMNYLQLIQFQQEKNEALVNQVNKIQTVSMRGQKITRQILNFVKKKEFELVKINLNDVLTEAVDILRVALPKSIQIEYKSEQDDIILNADATLIFQIILNLCLNASRAMDGQGKIDINISKEAIDQPIQNAEYRSDIASYACISIIDNGPGMSQELINLIMNKPLEIKKSKAGTGLGLSIVNQCIKFHKGFMKLKSESNIQTEFKVYLPIFTQKD